MLRFSCVLFLLVVAQGAAAQTYPSKPIRVYATSTAGGPLDVFMRLLANKMEEALKQPIVVESRPGAGGNLAASAVLAAPADGYSVLASIDTTFSVNPALFRKMPFDVERDFIPVSVLAKFGQILAVNPALEARNVKELIEVSKAKDLAYGSAGTALPSHLSFAFLQAVTGIRATHIPYKGNPPTLLALVSGEVQAAMVISTSILPHARSGKVRMLAYSDSTRSEVVPDVPTLAEQGYRDFEVVFAYVLAVAKDTPAAIVEQLHMHATRAVMSPDVRDKLRGVDTVPIALAPAESARWLRAARAKWAEVIERMAIRAE